MAFLKKAFPALITALRRAINLVVGIVGEIEGDKGSLRADWKATLIDRRKTTVPKYVIGGKGVVHTHDPHPVPLGLLRCTHRIRQTGENQDIPGRARISVVTKPRDVDHLPNLHVDSVPAPPSGGRAGVDDIRRESPENGTDRRPVHLKRMARRDVDVAVDVEGKARAHRPDADIAILFND